MSTKPAGASAYGDIANTRKSIHEEPHNRGGATVSTPEAEYTVDELIALINAAVADANVTTYQTTGGVTRTENYSGAIATLDTIVGGSGYTDGSYAGVPLLSTEGSGEGAVATIFVVGGAVTTVTLEYGGKLYAVDDTLTAPSGLLGAGTGFTVDVATIS